MTASADAVLARRRELADFLRTRRARLQPEDVGLPRGTRRRTPGLRREEVAGLAGVGATWYAWLEQGRDVQASREVLDAIARGLRLTAAERTHLLRLGRDEPPEPRAPERVAPSLLRLIDGLEASPAYVTGRRWDILAWNSAATAVFGDPAATPRPLRNQLWMLFMDPMWKAMLPSWDLLALQSVARFRAAHARHLDDPAFTGLVATLRNASPDFAAAWTRHDVAACVGGVFTVRHPRAGTVRMQTQMLSPQGDQEQRLIVYAPLTERDKSRVSTLWR